MNSIFKFNLDSKNNVLEIEKRLNVKIPTDFFNFLEKVNFENPFEIPDNFYEGIKIKNEYYSEKYYPNGHLLTFQGFLNVEEIISTNENNQVIESLGEEVGKNKISFLKEGSVLFLMVINPNSIEFGSIYVVDFDIVGYFSNSSNPLTYKVADSFTEFIEMFELFLLDSN